MFFVVIYIHNKLIQNKIVKYYLKIILIIHKISCIGVLIDVAVLTYISNAILIVLYTLLHIHIINNLNILKLIIFIFIYLLL